MATCKSRVSVYLLLLLGALYVATGTSSSCSGGKLMLTVEDYQAAALAKLPRSLGDYISKGSGKDSTMSRNYEYLNKVRVIPRYLRDLSDLNSSVTVMDRQLDMPIGIAPTGLHKRWHPDGELATVRAVASRNTIMIATIAGSVTLEDIRNEAPDTELWFQTFLMNDKNIQNDLIRRAEVAIYDALVIAIDMPVSGLRYYNIRNGHKDVHPYANTEGYKKNGTISLARDQITWDDLDEVIKKTHLPVIVKGVMTPEDTKKAQEHGARGVIVSNHGGRQIDGTISAIEALAEIVEAIPEARNKDSQFDIYYDGGIMSGLDIYRAIALGAKFVFAGRAPMYGLAVSGQEGVEHVLDILDDEFRTTMAQAGFKSVDSITRDSVDVKF